MTKVEVYGWGTDLRIVRITAKQKKELIAKGVTEDRLQELEFEASFSTGRSGFAVDGFELLVDGKMLGAEDLKDIRVKEWDAETFDRRYSYLVIEETQKGCWVSAKSRKHFRPDLVLMEAETVSLTDGTVYLLMDLTFDGKGEFGWSDGKAVDVFVVTPAGERHMIELLDDDD